MAALTRGQASDGANPALDLFTQLSGLLIDVVVAEYQIFDISDPGKHLNPVQVYPEAVGTRALVNVGVLSPDGDKLSTGHFVARWTAPLDAAIGTYEIRWFFRLTTATPEQTYREEFEVLAQVAGYSTSGYAFISDLRAEGITPNEASDGRVHALIALASRYIERMTSRFFEPRAQTLSLDGSGGRTLSLGHPIIGIDAVAVDSSPYSPADTAIYTSLFRVYNRHLTEGLLLPDDRDNPKIELYASGAVSALVWPKGSQNVKVTGLFGYTEPDGSPTGHTPDLIRHATKLLVLRELPLFANAGAREDAQRRHRLTSERTRDQSYTLEALRMQGAFTGDPEIDNILSAYQRTPDCGAA